MTSSPVRPNRFRTGSLRRRRRRRRRGFHRFVPRNDDGRACKKRDVYAFRRARVRRTRAFPRLAAVASWSRSLQRPVRRPRRFSQIGRRLPSARPRARDPSRPSDRSSAARSSRRTRAVGSHRDFAFTNTASWFSYGTRKLSVSRRRPAEGRSVLRVCT